MNREPDSFTVRCAMLRHAEMPKEPRRVPTVATGSLTAHQTRPRGSAFFFGRLVRVGTALSAFSHPLDLKEASSNEEQLDPSASIGEIGRSGPCFQAMAES